MAISQGIFNPGSRFDERYIPDYERLAEFVQALKTIGLTVVLTSGSYDLIHEGHVGYLERAKECGDVLVVGVDSDEKIRARKGPSRPVVGENERLRMLTHQRHPDIVTLKPIDGEKWALIKAVRPDVLVATEDNYTADELEQLLDFCGKVEVLPRMAVTSTTSRLRHLRLELADKLTKRLNEKFPAIIEQLFNDELGQDGKELPSTTDGAARD
ncbi:MAG: adenylyltransferase/cytidyltransferase family protein [Candidatus Saccharibacteria bacterium]